MLNEKSSENYDWINLSTKSTQNVKNPIHVLNILSNLKQKKQKLDFFLLQNKFYVNWINLTSM